MYDELTEVDIKKMEEEIAYRTEVLGPQLLKEMSEHPACRIRHAHLVCFSNVPEYCFCFRIKFYQYLVTHALSSQS